MLAQMAGPLTFGMGDADETSMRVFVVLFALVFASGCFIADEIDSGVASLPQKPKPEAEKEPERAAAPSRPTSSGSEDPGLFSSLLGLAQEELEPEPAPPDPAEMPVRCWIGKRENFTTRRDCESRGGKAVDLPE